MDIRVKYFHSYAKYCLVLLLSAKFIMLRNLWSTLWKVPGEMDSLWFILTHDSWKNPIQVLIGLNSKVDSTVLSPIFTPPCPRPY